MMKLTVNPNRMELLKLKRREQFAVRGHKLLKDKQISLMQQFMRILKDIKEQYAEVEKELFKAYESFYQAQVGSEPFAIEEALETPSVKTGLAVVMKYVMGRKTPFFEIGKIDPQTLYGAATAPVALREMVQNVTTVFPRIILLAQTEKQIELLAAEIEKTRRRVNALEYNLIPALKEAIHEIVMKLEERDRSERTKLMKIKEMMTA